MAIPIEVFEKILERIEKRREEQLSENGEAKIADAFTDSDMQILASMFEKTFVNALDIVEQKLVTVETCPSGRKVMRVRSQNTPEKQYQLLANSLYCNCPAFALEVIAKEKIFACKHLLAARIAVALQYHQTEQLSNDEISRRLLTCMFPRLNRK